MANGCKSFRSCYKWSLDLNEVEFRENGQMFSTSHNIVYARNDYKISEYSRTVHVCIPKGLLAHAGYYIDIFYVAAGLLSIASLVVTIGVLCCKSTKTNIAARSPILCHMVTLLVFFVTSEIYMLLPLRKGFGCQLIIYVTLLTSRSAFCWLNVVFFHMWRKFRLSNITNQNASVFSWKIFAFQLMYSWGFPALVIIVVRFCMIQPDVAQSPDDKCTHHFLLRNDKLMMLLTDVTSALPMVANIVFAVIIILNIRKIGKQVKDCNVNAPKKLLSVHIKLVVMTGTAWLIRSVQWMTIPFMYNQSIFWMISDVLTPLQGFFLLLIFCCSFYTFDFNCSK